MSEISYAPVRPIYISRNDQLVRIPAGEIIPEFLSWPAANQRAMLQSGTIVRSDDAEVTRGPVQQVLKDLGAPVPVAPDPVEATFADEIELGVAYECDLCEKKYPTSHGLSVHKGQKHR